MQHLERVEILIDRLGALDVQHRRKHAVGDALFDVRGVPADLHLAAGLRARSGTAATAIASVACSASRYPAVEASTPFSPPAARASSDGGGASPSRALALR